MHVYKEGHAAVCNALPDHSTNRSLECNQLVVHCSTLVTTPQHRGNNGSIRSTITVAHVLESGVSRV